jgi:hypothetical protein
MGEKTRNNNANEDELNQARFFAERGADVGDVEEPGDDGIEIEEEDISDTKSEFREQPAIRPESKIADQSRFYGQGFKSGDDTGIRREASDKGEEPDVES